MQAPSSRAWPGSVVRVRVWVGVRARVRVRVGVRVRVRVRVGVRVRVTFWPYCTSISAASAVLNAKSSLVRVRVRV